MSGAVLVSRTSAHLGNIWFVILELIEGRENLLLDFTEFSRHWDSNNHSQAMGLHQELVRWVFLWQHLIGSVKFL